MIYLDTAEGVYRPGVDFLERELARYGASLTDSISYESDISRAQEQARVIIARLKDRGVTTVLFSGDPLAPIFLTQEATRQQYFPEWVIPGGTLVDTNFFGRTYDQRQWAHAFGISQLWIRPPNAQAEAYYQHQQYFGRPPTAAATPEIPYLEIHVLATGIHMAGPNLNPATFRDGLFAFPPSGGGRVTVLQKSWGNHGVWPTTDWTAFDSVSRGVVGPERTRRGRDRPRRHRACSSSSTGVAATPPGSGRHRARRLQPRGRPHQLRPASRKRPLSHLSRVREEGLARARPTLA